MKYNPFLGEVKGRRSDPFRPEMIFFGETAHSVEEETNFSTLPEVRHFSFLLYFKDCGNRKSRLENVDENSEKKSKVRRFVFVERAGRSEDGAKLCSAGTAGRVREEDRTARGERLGRKDEAPMT